ncbi:MAG: hypothetical protein GF308_02265 [Candidatus Heimdallarchaeota archaeon]|nr:hypothetical protein [Candidatus Heimdallarchaeota archaeon]
MPTEKFLEDLTKLQEDSIHGAVYLTLEALKILKEEVERSSIFSKELKAIINEIKQTHEEMASISNVMNNILAQINKEEEISQEKMIEIIEKEIHVVKHREKKTVENLAKKLRKYQTIMTISASGTILEAFKEIPQKLRQKIEIYILESRPMFEGRQQAKKLVQEGFNVYLIVDAAMGFYLGNVEMIIVGADTIFPDGAAVNKIGSLPLAVLANYYKKPFFVAASSNKLVNLPTENYPNLIKSRPKKEVMTETIQGLEIKNIYFEFIPAELITEIISED